MLTASNVLGMGRLQIHTQGKAGEAQSGQKVVPPDSRWSFILACKTVSNLHRCATLRTRHHILNCLLATRLDARVVRVTLLGSFIAISNVTTSSLMATTRK